MGTLIKPIELRTLEEMSDILTNWEEIEYEDCSLWYNTKTKEKRTAMPVEVKNNRKKMELIWRKHASKNLKINQTFLKQSTESKEELNNSKLIFQTIKETIS